MVSERTVGRRYARDALKGRHPSHVIDAFLATYWKQSESLSLPVFLLACADSFVSHWATGEHVRRDLSDEPLA